MRALLLAVIGLLAAMSARAADRAAFDWQQHPGASLPTDTVLRDERGAAVPLRGLLNGVPVILDLGYFHCPSLCGVVRDDLLHALNGSGLVAGRDYVLAAVSIDPHETAADAAAAKTADLTAWHAGSGADWHYLTGSATAIAAISTAVGFPAEYDARVRQFLHPTGLVLLNGSGIVSSYLLGVGYNAGDLRTAVIRARSGGIARASLPVLLLCFHYDAATGRYTLEIIKLLRLLGGLTLLTLVALFVILSRHRPRGAR